MLPEDVTAILVVSEINEDRSVGVPVPAGTAPQPFIQCATKT
jgi:hypothetical protein